MLIDRTNRKFEIVTEMNTCDYHKRRPGANWPGCTCWASYTEKEVENNNQIQPDGEKDAAAD